MDQVVERISRVLNQSSDTKAIMDGFESSIIKKENFKIIEKDDRDRKITFVDGGNSEIINSPGFSVHFVRVYFCSFYGKKVIDEGKKEFYCFCSVKKSGNKIKYVIDTDPEFISLEVDSNDSNFSFNKSRMDISMCGELVRRLAELKIASRIDGDVIIDGSLEVKNQFEGKLIRDNLLGFCKTNSIVTEGSSLSYEIFKIEPKNCEWYVKIGESKNLDVYVAKLHKNSEHFFRIDVKHGSEISGILSNLVKNSCDPVFLGYPYGLVRADRFARVSNSECDEIKIKIAAKLGSDSEKLKRIISSKSAHSILDNIS